MGPGPGVFGSYDAEASKTTVLLSGTHRTVLLAGTTMTGGESVRCRVKDVCGSVTANAGSGAVSTTVVDTV